MSVEIRFPIEFIVRGTPVSFQAARGGSKEAWKRRVKEASYDALPEGHFATEAFHLRNADLFSSGQDAGRSRQHREADSGRLTKHIYYYDRQVERIWVQKFEPGRIFPFARPSKALAEALSADKPLLFIRLGDDPAEGLA